jgi:hypothetical protein
MDKMMIIAEVMSDILCVRCGAPYSLRYGEDPTPNCDSCAHELVSEQQAEIENLKIELSEMKKYVLSIEEELRALYVSIREKQEKENPPNYETLDYT